MNLISKLVFLALAKASAAGAHEFVRGNRIGDATQAEVEDTMEVDAEKLDNLHVKVLYCKDLPDLDTVCFNCGETDAYAEMTVFVKRGRKTKRITKRTTTKWDTLDPVWNEEFDFEIGSLRYRTLYVDFYDNERGFIDYPFVRQEIRLDDQGLDDKGTTKEFRLTENWRNFGYCMIEVGYTYAKYSCYKEKVVENKWSDCGKGCGAGWKKHPTHKRWGNHCNKWKPWKKNWYCQKVKLDCPSDPCRRCSASEIAEEALANE